MGFTKKVLFYIHFLLFLFLLFPLKLYAVSLDIISIEKIASEKLQTNNFSEAEFYLRQLLEQEPLNWFARTKYAYVLFHLQKYAESRSEFYFVVNHSNIARIVNYSKKSITEINAITNHNNKTYGYHNVSFISSKNNYVPIGTSNLNLSTKEKETTCNTIYCESSNYNQSYFYGYNNYAPNNSGSSTGTVHVSGYYRSNGTYVSPHTRSSPSRKN